METILYLLLQLMLMSYLNNILSYYNLNDVSPDNRLWERQGGYLWELRVRPTTGGHYEVCIIFNIVYIYCNTYYISHIVSLLLFCKLIAKEKSWRPERQWSGSTEIEKYFVDLLMTKLSMIDVLCYCAGRSQKIKEAMQLLQYTFKDNQEIRGYCCWNFVV